MEILCPHCQNRIESEQLADEVLCPACGSSFRLDRAATTDWKPSAGHKRLGKFELIDQVGMGAFGTVYKARDTELDRIVAIKVPRGGHVGSTGGDTDRFLREARSVAQLRHPSIVAVHEVGQHESLPYLVADFVEGVTLADLLTSRRLAPRQAAKLIAQVADALEYAHSQGVVHRDVKPSNIMLDDDLTPHVMDFGLAKRDAGEVTMTVEGQVLGTPAYTSPEQARGESHKVDGRSDVYSLGVILYELLTGELPFRGNVRMLLHQVLHDEPRSLRSLNDRIPRDLETICLKAMAKEPARRYATARDLADELRRWLAGEPIQARPVGRAEQAWRWCRRNPVVAGLTAALLLVFLTGFAGVTWKWLDAERQKEIAGEQRQIAVTQADLATQEAEKSRRLLYASDLNVAHQLWEAGNLARARELLERQRPRPDQEDLRSFEWRYLWRLCQDGSLHTFSGHTQEVTAVAYSPDGTLLASASLDRSVRLWDVATRSEVGALRGHGAGVTSLAFSRDGKTLATASTDSIRLWDVAAQREVGRLPGPWGNELAFSPDGTLLASLNQDQKGIRLWDVATRQEVGTLLGHTERVMSVAFSPDGRTVASGSYNGMLLLWDVGTQRELAKLEGHKGQIGVLAFSPDGKTLASASPDAGVKLWDSGTRQPFATLRDFAAPVTSLAFSPDNKLLVTGIGDRTVKLWDAVTKEEVATLRGHTAKVTTVAFAQGGQTLATASTDQTVKLWQVTKGQDPNTLTGLKAEVRGVAISKGGQTLAVADHLDQTVKLWDLASRQQVATLTGHTGNVWTATFAPDGRTLASTSGDKTVRLWNVATRQQVAEFRHPNNSVRSAAFSPNGKLLAACDYGANVLVWEIAAERKVAQLQGGGGEGVQFSPDGTLLASGQKDHTVQLWDVATWQPVATFTGHTAAIRSLAFSADGKLLATGSDDYTARLWDVATGRAVAILKGSSFRVIAVALAPDGKTLATGGDNHVRLWNVTIQQEVATLRGHYAPVLCLAFSPDGNLLASSAGDGTVRLWPAASFHETDAPLDLRPPASGAGSSGR